MNSNTLHDLDPWVLSLLVTTAAIPASAAAAPGPCGAHAAAGSALVSAALKAKNRHHALHIGGTAGIAADRFIATKHEFLESYLTTVTFKLIDGHWIFTSTHKIWYSLTINKSNYRFSPGQPD
jgi:hypothetical protein